MLVAPRGLPIKGGQLVQTRLAMPLLYVPRRQGTQREGFSPKKLRPDACMPGPQREHVEARRLAAVRGGHGVQMAALRGEEVFSKQLRQRLSLTAPKLGLNVPAGHGRQLVGGSKKRLVR